MVSNFFIFVVCCLLFKDCESTVVFAQAGSVAVLPCTLYPQTVAPAITWSKEGRTIWRMGKSGLQFWNSGWASRVSCPHTQYVHGDYSLHLQNVKVEDAGLFSCTLDKTKGSVVTFITLRVITVTITPAAPVLGQNVQISCSVYDGKRLVDSKVRWMVNNRPYNEPNIFSIRTTFKQNRDSLRVKAAHSVKGTWTCVVNQNGTEGRASALLDVKGIIQPSTDDAQIYAAVGSAVTLPCVFSDGLITSNSLWERLQNTSASKPALGKLPGSFSAPAARLSPQDKSAELREVSFEDAGRYRCSATAHGLRVERSMRLVTAKVEASEKGATLTLTCQLSDSRSITDYEWIYTASDLNGTQFIAFVQKGKTVTLREASEGQWTCRFYGEQGVLGNVTYDIQRIEKLSEEKPSRVSHQVAVLIGLSLFLVIIVLTLNQMYKNHQRRKNILQFTALETIVHNNSVEREMRERNQIISKL